MSIEVVFYDYVDNNGVNRIKSWMSSIGKKPKSKINAVLLMLSNVPVSDWHKHSKAVKNLKGQDDLWEIRAFVDKVQWRPIGILGPGEKAFTLLVGALKKQQQWEPPAALQTAHNRKNEVRNATGKHRTHHE